MIEALAQDIRYAARSLRASPLFTIVAVATLAIGIGATTAIFSTVNATLLRPLPYPKFGELVDVQTHLQGGRVTSGLLSIIQVNALNGLQSLVSGAAGISGQPFDATLMRGDGTPVNAVMNGVTEGFFDVLGLPMTRGRAFTPGEHVMSGRDAPMSVVLSYRAWMTLFGRDPDIVGKSIRLAEVQVATTIVGVAPPALDLPHDTDFWFNLRTNPQSVSHNFATIVRLRPGASLDALRSAAAVKMKEIARTVPTDIGREFVMRPLVASLVGDLGLTLLIVLGATTLLLVLACLNVTNLLLARGMARTREIAVRTALGASRGRIVRQLLTESLVLATGGALAGLALAYFAVRLLLVLGASKLPRLDSVPFDSRVLLFAVGVLLFSGLTTGVAPAWRLAATDITSLLNESGRNATSSRGTSRLMSTLIVAEIALALALVAGAGWLVQSFERLGATDPGFTATGRLVVDVRPTRSFAQRADMEVWSNDMLDRVRASAGGARVGSASTFPLRIDHDGIFNVEIDGDPPDPDSSRGGRIRVVTPGFFEAMGIQVLAGRTFTADDRKGTQPVAIVNRTFAHHYFQGREPLAGSFAYGFPTVDRKSMSRIVGVVQDVRYKSLAEEAEPTFYLVQAQAPFPFARQAVVVAARAGDPQALVSPIRAELNRFDPQLMVSFTTAPQIVAETLGRQKLGMTLMLIFGATALVLAAIGIYGVIAYAAAQRSGELATRIALGAAGHQIFWLMMSTGQRLAIAGVILGLAAAYAGGRLVASSVFAMRAADPVVLIGAGALVAAVACIATMIPAIRASRLDPVRALRAE